VAHIAEPVGDLSPKFLYFDKYRKRTKKELANSD